MILTARNIAVITGGPGAGKTTLCEQLAGKGISIGSESGRAVLSRNGGHELRQQDPLAYALEILKLDIDNFKAAHSRSERWLFDRGFADNAGFLDLMGLPIADEVDQACRTYRYQGPVFIAPPWREIYQQDDDRIQGWQEARATYFAVKAAWERYGYDPVTLPKMSVEERASFVLDRLA